MEGSCCHGSAQSPIGVYVAGLLHLGYDSPRTQYCAAGNGDACNHRYSGADNCGYCYGITGSDGDADTGANDYTYADDYACAYNYPFTRI